MPKFRWAGYRRTCGVGWPPVELCAAAFLLMMGVTALAGRAGLETILGAFGPFAPATPPAARPRSGVSSRSLAWRSGNCRLDPIGASADPLQPGCTLLRTAAR